MTGTTIDLRFQSATWVGPSTPPERRRSKYTFRADWNDTITLLVRELELLDASDIVIEAGLRREDIRVDGWPRANAPQPEHPGVRIFFASKHGPLRYETDAFETWQANLRAIALGLEALRKVERYGIARRGEQYTGWKALPAGSAPPPPPPPMMTRDGAALIIAELASMPGVTVTREAVLDEVAEGGSWLMSRARRNAHPDTGGSDSKFKSYQQAERTLMGQRTLTAP
jgi:hypothetical protein